MSKEFYYRIIPESRVDAEKVLKAGKVLEFCKQHLKKMVNRKIPEFELFWIEETGQKDFEGDDVFRKLQENINKLFSVENPEAFKPMILRDGDDFLGMCQVIKHPDGSKSPRILLRSDIPVRQIPGTLAHELYHLISWDMKGQRPFTQSELNSQERLADGFAKDLIAEMNKRVYFRV